MNKFQVAGYIVKDLTKKHVIHSFEKTLQHILKSFQKRYLQ
jgi:hypothetical protein